MCNISWLNDPLKNQTTEKKSVSNRPYRAYPIGSFSVTPKLFREQKDNYLLDDQESCLFTN